MGPSTVLLVSFFMLGLVLPSVLSCMCQPTHPQRQFCRADLVIIGRVQTKLFLHGPPDPSILSGQPTIVSYKIHITSVKKGQGYAGQLWNVQDNELVVNTTARNVSCGVPWLEVGQRYLLTVNVVNGKASLQFCHFHRPYSELTTMQRRGINGAYNRGCAPQCQIYTCRPYAYCPPTTPNDITCIHGNSNTHEDCYYHHGYCMAKPTGKCAWKTIPIFDACVSSKLKKFDFTVLLFSRQSLFHTMRAVSVVILVGVLFTYLTGSQACSCAPSHPQDQFCRADFVVKASVVSSQYIYKPTQAPATEPTTEPTAEPSSDYWSVVDEEEALVMGNLAEVPGELLQRRPPAGMMAPVFMAPGFSSETQEDNRPIKLEYTVKVEKIFKGDNYLQETLAKIYTQPNDGICGRTDLTDEKSYVIAGTFYDNELRISTCSWIVPYKSLTRIQRRGVKLMYKKSCGDCRIANCYRTTCKYVQPSDDVCMFDIARMANSCEGQHSYCSRSKSACKWQRNKDYKQCYMP
ncbi:uncharacterized protein LOC119731834 [Patiria miniata]|uniref:NTR domain-containing protein n=1 Tax=Patiria miniata TaxID=46514 RepID=A0A914ABB2_PATMI|nr:uncharacterized protein LOC119731834 [Patiria miniata]